MDSDDATDSIFLAGEEIVTESTSTCSQTDILHIEDEGTESVSNTYYIM